MELSLPEQYPKYPMKRSLSEHIKCHFTTHQRVCEMCGKVFCDAKRLGLHIKTFHTDRPKPVKIPHQCTFCGKWYSSQENLGVHIKNLHENSDVEHRCDTCGFVSTTARALKRHVLFNHNAVRRHQCSLCEKAFKRKQDVKEHMATHTGESLYTCKDCQASFKSKANLYHHRRRLHKAEWMAARTKPPKEKYSRN